MPLRFTNHEEEPEPQASGSGQRIPPRTGIGIDVLDQGEPNPPPAALMRKRASVFLWILLALGLGGLIALAMVAMSD
ncbi:MAG: hypothetical protein WA823_09505 [Candidatus Acidiferrales bacterium]